MRREILLSRLAARFCYHRGDQNFTAAQPWLEPDLAPLRVLRRGRILPRAFCEGTDCSRDGSFALRPLLYYAIKFYLRTASNAARHLSTARLNFLRAASVAARRPSACRAIRICLYDATTATRRRLKNLYPAPYLLRNGAEISTQNRRHEIYAPQDKICAALCGANPSAARAIKF